MIPIKSTIKGFGPFTDTVTVQWDTLNSPVAVIGPYGSGKTWLIESVFACHYGSYVWYDGASIYDGLTQGGDGKAEITLEFEHVGKRYLASREFTVTGKTKSQQALLSEVLSDGAHPVAGPKAGDFDRSIQTLLGDKETALGSWFLSQNRKHDLVGQPGETSLAQRRRNVFNELIGASSLDEISEKAGNILRTKTTEIDVLDAQLSTTRDYQALIDEAHRTKTLAESSLAKERIGIESCEFQLTTAQDDLSKAQQEQAALEAQCETLKVTKKRLDDITGRITLLTSKAKLETSNSSRIEKLQAKITERDKLQDELTNIQTQQDLDNAWSIWNSKKELIASQGQHTVQMKAELEEEYSQHPQVPCTTRMAEDCPLLTKWKEIPNKIQALSNTVGEQRTAYTDHLALQPPKGEPVDPQHLSSLKTRIQALQGAERDLALSEKAAADLIETKAEQKETIAQAIIIGAEYDEIQAKTQDAVDRSTNLTQSVTSLQQTISDLHSQIDFHNNSIQQQQKEIGQQEATIKGYEQAHGELQDKQTQVSALRIEVPGLTDLRNCFGPKGVRQILIDQAAPELEEIADALFDIATEGAMRLRITTQKTNADGTIAEDFDILVRDHRGERPALKYSGGQLQLILILFRIAVAIWVGKIRGQTPECLFLDEAFDRLGGEGSQDLLRVLETLGKRFGKIVVVTHDPTIAERLGSMVSVIPHPHGSTVI